MDEDLYCNVCGQELGEELGWTCTKCLAAGVPKYFRKERPTTSSDKTVITQESNIDKVV